MRKSNFGLNAGVAVLLMSSVSGCEAETAEWTYLECAAVGYRATDGSGVRPTEGSELTTIFIKFHESSFVPYLGNESG